MPDIRIEKRHNFDLETARTQAKKWLEEAKATFGVDATYEQGIDADTVAIKKSGVDGCAFLVRIRLFLRRIWHFWRSH